MTKQPEACPKCGAEATLRKMCPRCGEGVWVIPHNGHYMGGGNEVVPCACSQTNSKESIKLRQEKLNRRAIRDTGKPLHDPARRQPPVTTPEMAKKAAEGLARGLKPGRALREAGFPPATFRRGKAGVNRMVRAELKNLGRKYIEMGRDLSPEEQELIVRGMLLENVLLKTDKGVLAAKQLGADKRIAMWQPDSQVGLVVLQAPPIPKIDHEVPLLPPIEPPKEEA